MRRTGRTTRIKNFIVEQLMSVGGCVATDHTSFEQPGVPLDSLRHLIRSVEKDIHELTNGELVVKYEMYTIDNIKCFIFRTELIDDGKTI